MWRDNEIEAYLKVTSITREIAKQTVYELLNKARSSAETLNIEERTLLGELQLGLAVADDIRGISTDELVQYKLRQKVGRCSASELS